MDASQWSRVSDVFSRAIELDSPARLRLLQAEAENVRNEVERLLGEHQRGGILDRAILANSEIEHRSGELLNGRYRIERFLARGGAGAVYLARDEQIAGRAVVVKFLEHHDPWFKNKFREEMEALARIDHHGVVGVLDAGQTPDRLPFLVIEHIDGVTLRPEIQKGPMNRLRVARLIRQIGDAVFAAHEKGVLHRDLKPENIMLERAGSHEETVRLIDFGIARVERPEQGTRTLTTRFAGTTMYMAPEQLTGHPQASSDVYAMGVLAYEMLSGRRPFPAESPVELYQDQRAGASSDLHRLRPEVPAAAVRMILKQLSFRPDDRSRTAREAGEQIAAGLEGQLTELWPRRSFVGALAGGASLLAAGTYIWSRSRPLHPSERVIEVAMGSEILEHGFQKDRDISYQSLVNAEATRLESIRVWTADQGEYFHPLTAVQAREAQLKGWTLTIEAALEQGRMYWAIDSPRAPCRYSAYLQRNPDNTDTVGCVLIVAPAHQGIDRVLPGPTGARHRMVMKWTPSTEAEFWVDGRKLVSGYRGTAEFRYARGLTFGATRYRSGKAAARFWTIRLEIA